jgi:hypothetical protein
VAGISKAASSGDNSSIRYNRNDALRQNLPIQTSWGVVALLLLLLAGCSTIEHASANKKLQMQLDSYGHAVRWGNLEEMYAFVKPEDEPLVVPEGLDNLRVTNYEPLTTITEVPDKRIRRRVKIEYLHRDRQVVKKLIDDQVWEYDEQAEQWFRSNLPPSFE